ncbi:hypothetical protein [Sulfitobacter sp. JB4-11]|uniref:hypothetical protein n=1 Tax=Sulfitobacter rhodophyticola TaxID=3238304 RepID=UPI003A78BFEF
MKNEELGKLSYEVSEEGMKKIVEAGRLLEFANTVATSAAAEIHAQIVDQVARAAVGGKAVGGVSVGSVNIFEGGDFGTVPIGPRGPRPRFTASIGGALSHVVDIAEIQNVRG